MKGTLLIALLLGCMACQQQPKQTSTVAGKVQSVQDTANKKAFPPEQLIIPGKGVGHIRLNEDADSVILSLGKPNKVDAAMGASMMTWFAGHDTIVHALTVYAHHNMGGKDENVAHVKQIRITSPAFQTKEWLHAGSLLQEISQHYQLKPHSIPGMSTGKMYDDQPGGIAFEIGAGDRCTAVIVHAPKDSLATYLNMR